MFKKNIIQSHETDSINSCTPKDKIVWPCFEQNMDHDGRLDHFIHTNQEIFAGRHLIIDFWGAEKLDDVSHMESALRIAIEKSKATLLHIHLHHFSPNGGISGVAVLAESHISVHTWPEKNFAAFDVFMCGNSEPHKAVEVLKEFFKPTEHSVKTIKRGKIK